MTDPVAWDLAERVAVRVAGNDPFACSYHYDSLEPDFAELTAEAEELVAGVMGMRSLAGPARARVTDRAGWVRANIASFQRLLRPVTDKLAPRMAGSPMAPLTRTIAGAQVGTMLGWMATRVLGQYDLLLIEEEDPENQDIVYYVGPNVLAIEKRFAFPPRQFRLWLALHEVTHRTQFTSVPWLRDHVHAEITQFMLASEIGPSEMLERLAAAGNAVVDAVRGGESSLLEAVQSEQQREVLDRLTAVMTLVEGHGDYVMDGVGPSVVPSVAEIREKFQKRRASGNALELAFRRLIGIDLKMKQYEQGATFVRTVVDKVGMDGFNRVWTSPNTLPTRAEIADPDRWIARVVRPGLTEGTDSGT